MVIEFFKRVGLSIYPISYHEFAQKSFKEVFSYFLGVLVLGLIITNILLLPTYLSLPDTLVDAIGHFDSFSIDGDIKMNAPIEIPKKEAAVAIDTTGTITEIETERVVLTQDYLYYKPFLGTKRVLLDDLLDITAHPGTSAWLITGLLALLLPSLVFYAGLGLILKYLILIGLTGLILYFIVRVLLLYEISFRNAINCAFYAGTLLILIESIVFAIDKDLLLPILNIGPLHLYVVSYAVFLGYAILSLTVVEKGIKLGRKKKETKKEE